MAETSRIDEIIEKTNAIVANQNFSFICLINNASAVEPIGPIEKCPVDAIESHVKIGLVTPMLLTSMFIQQFTGGKMRKKVAFISSGAAFTPLPDSSIYCSSKAGMHMFAQCVGLEQKNKTDGFEVISIGPGMVDTATQLATGSKSKDDFALADFFKQAYEDGKLQEPGKVAEKIYTILLNKDEQGKTINISGL